MMYVATLIADVPNEELLDAFIAEIKEKMTASSHWEGFSAPPEPHIERRGFFDEVCNIYFSYEELDDRPDCLIPPPKPQGLIQGWIWKRNTRYCDNNYQPRLYGIEPLKVVDIINQSIGNKKIDCIIQPNQGIPIKSTNPKKLLISDMDSTMIEQECIDELADFVGKKAQVAAITERAMNGELVFEEALRERVALLAGLPVETLQECFDTKITMMGGARELVAAFKNRSVYPDRPKGAEGSVSTSERSLGYARDEAIGGKCVLVSGGFTFFTERVARELGFDEHYANLLEIENGKLTGKVVEPILGKEAKLAELHRQCEMLNIKPENVIAIGDGANDLPMLKAAGLGIAYHAKPSVQAQVTARINHNNLSAIIHCF